MEKQKITKEDKELLLKDLCARLPYKFIIHRYCDNVDISICDIDEFAHFLEYSEGEDFKPYLRPMSSMTEEEKLHYIVLGDIKRYINPQYAYLISEQLDYLNAHHLDYRGLIEKGLALEAPEGMYES